MCIIGLYKIIVKFVQIPCPDDVHMNNLEEYFIMFLQTLLYYMRTPVLKKCEKE